MANRRHEIVRYYDECEIDYRLIWRLDRAMAMHYGYWDEGVRGLPAALLRMNEVLAETVEIGPDDHVLDAGCGVGGSSLFLSERYGCRVTGITLSQRQAERAQAHAERLGLAKRVRFAVGDFTKMPFEDGSFDVVWALESVCYADRKSAFVDEAYRVLREGERLVLADGFAFRDDLSAEEAEILRRWLVCWAVESLDSPMRFSDHLKRAGFEDCDYRDISREVMPASKRLYLASLLSLAGARLLKWFGLRSAVQMENVRGCYHQRRAFRSGVARYGLFRARKPLGPGAHMLDGGNRASPDCPVR